MEIDVEVRKGGHVVGLIRRPLRELSGAPAVTYRGRLWPLHEGAIDIQPAPDIELSTPMPDRHDSKGTGQRIDEDRERMIHGPASEGTGPRIGEDRECNSHDPKDEGTEPRMDKEQEHVICAPPTARILVQAGPGSGKTEVTARRITHLLDSGLSPSRILVLSFSRSAVRTLTRRLSAVSGARGDLENLRHVSIRTFDSWAFRLLRLTGEQPGQLLSRPHEANIEALADLIAGPRREEIRDFLGDRRHVFVDEFQDLTGCRALLARQLLELLAPPDRMGCGFTLLGDPAQAIYGFAAKESDSGSGIDVWEEIRSRYSDGAELVALRRNHRSVESIAALSNGLRTVLESELPPDEKLESVRDAIHSLPTASEIGPDWIWRPYATSAILTRTNGDAIRVMQRLLGSDVGAGAARVVLKAGTHAAQPPAWVAALLAPLKSSSVPKSQFDRIWSSLAARLDGPAKDALALPGQNDAWLRLLHAAGQAGEDSSLDTEPLHARLGWPDAFPDDELLPEDGLYVTTVHQSKGMEFDEVHILESRAADLAQDASPLEEASVGFVGLSRAGQKIGRIPSDAIYSSLTKRKFPRGGDRLYSWWRGWVNLEMGLPGDVSAASFVDEAVHESGEAVKEVQRILLEDANGLRGRKVQLCKGVDEGGKVHYDIHLQNQDGRPELRLGRTTNQLTTVLLDLLHDKGYYLPTRIFNLRIASLVTMTAGEESVARIPEPWNTSRFWLGCTLVGTGDFRTFKRTEDKI